MAQARDRELQEELQAVRVRIAELEEALKSAREALDAARDRRGELAAAQARVQSDVQHTVRDLRAGTGPAARRA